MHFDSYMISETQTAKTLPLTCPPPYSSKALEDFGKLKKRGFKGFTLAETLITLTIVGVIAAITVPTLISNYQKHTFVVGLKNAYSDLKNASKLLPITYGCQDWESHCFSYYGGMNSRERNAVLKRAFKVVKECTNEEQPRCPAWNIKNNNDALGSPYHYFVTANGMAYSAGFNGASYGIVVDVNGIEKGPNLMGRDTFQFMIIDGDRANDNFPLGSIIPFGSKQWSQMVGSAGYWKNSNACDGTKLNTTESGTNLSHTHSLCTGRVLEEDAMNY